jgi:hypothetical protein
MAAVYMQPCWLCAAVLPGICMICLGEAGLDGEPWMGMHKHAVFLLKRSIHVVLFVLGQGSWRQGSQGGRLTPCCGWFGCMVSIMSCLLDASVCQSKQG